MYFNQKLNKIKTANVDFFSDIISKDAFFVKDCLRRLLKNIYQLCPGLAEVKRIFFWTDVGQHFRCEEVAHFFIVDVPREFHVTINWDTFVECHGKSTVDSHFGVLSQWIEDFTDKKKIATITDLVKTLEDKVRRTNKYQSASKKTIYKFFIYEQHGRPTTFNSLSIQNIKRYYHFETRKKDKEHNVVKIKVTSESPYITEESFSKKIKVVEHAEKRVTKYSSKCTEESSKMKVQKMGVNQVGYGPQTENRLIWQKAQLSIGV